MSRSDATGAGGRPPLTAGGWLRFDAIRRAVSFATPRSILEIGAGEGALATWLARRAHYVGAETDNAARAIAERRLADSPGRVVADTGALAGRRFDLLCAFEVLEHIEDDIGALREWSGLLAPDGWVLVSVPAHQHRFGAGDRVAGHQRRYEAANLRALFEAAGFEPVTLESYGAIAGHALETARNVLASRAPARSAEEATAGSGRYLQPRSLAGVWARAAYAAPARVLQHPLRHANFGIGYVALGRRA